MFHSTCRRLAPALLCALLFVGLTPAKAANEVRRAAAPAWVASLELPKRKPARDRQADEGLYYLLIDHQFRPEPGGDTDYHRHAYQVLDRSGLENGARFDLDFDPVTETMVLHHIRILRDGVVQDRLAGARVQILNREQELSEGIFTGEKTAHVELEDVRVGDIVDYAYSWVTRDPRMSGHVYSEQSLGWTVPAGITRYRVVWPHGTAPTIRRYAGAPAPQVVRGNAWDIYEWSIADAEPVPGEKDTPDGIPSWSTVRVSDLAAWSQVADWSAPLYAGHDAPEAWKGELARIAAAWSDPKDRITETVRLVQDKIRYVSLSIGAGAYRPRSPDAVVRSGYGDCKDKSLLLSVLLRAQGIDATPALTDMDEGQALPDQPPSLAAFDHVIVRIRLGGRTYWVDATDSHAGGRFPKLAALSYGWALPIVPGQAALEAIPPSGPPRVTSNILERLVLSRGAKAAVTLAVTSVFNDAGADSLRRSLANRSLAETEKKYLDYYGDLYPGIRASQPVTFTDDRDANVLTVHELYEIPHEALMRAGLMNRFPLRAGTMEAYSLPAAGPRRTPLWLPNPTNAHHRIVLVTPEGRPPAPPTADIEGDGFQLKGTVTRKGHELTLDYLLTGATTTLPAGKVADFRDRVAQLNDAVYWYVDLGSTSGGTIGDDSAALGYAAVAILVLLFGGMIYVAVRYGGQADDAYASEGRYYPVTALKFLIMSAATAGLYPLFWQWKCWRWARRVQGEPISAAWRAFFGIVWLNPLFRRGNDPLTARKLPTWLGIGGVAGYLLWAVAWNALDRIDKPPGVWPAAYAGFIFYLPAVIAILRLNADAPQVVVANSRFTRLSWLAMGAGLGVWILYGFTENA